MAKEKTNKQRSTQFEEWNKKIWLCSVKNRKRY